MTKLCSCCTAATILLLVGGCGRNDAAGNIAVANGAAAGPSPRASAASPAPPVDGEPFEVAADPDAIHRLIEWRELPNGNREALTMRDGPDRGSFARRQVQFARREIDCETIQFRFLGEGATAEEARRANAASSPMAPPLRDSVSKAVSDLVCSKAAGRSEPGR